MKYMVKKILLVLMMLVTHPAINNGYHQATRIEIDGINEECYGTLLSSKAESGYWSSQMVVDLRAPDKVLYAFQNYEDPDRYLYLNYLQDVSEGLLYWMNYPPEEFKLLLYYPDSDTFVNSDTTYTRYALTSTYHARIENGVIHLDENYNYLQLILLTIVRILIGLAVTILIVRLYGKIRPKDIKLVFLTSLIYQVVLNVLISIYSFKNGFSIVEYFMFLAVPYILFFLWQGHLYSTKAEAIPNAYYCSFFSNLCAYCVGLALVDFVPKLFTIV